MFRRITRLPFWPLALAVLAPILSGCASGSAADRLRLSQIPVARYEVDTSTTVTSGPAARAALAEFAAGLHAALADPDLLPRRNPAGATVTIRVADLRLREDGIATAQSRIVTTGGMPIYNGNIRPVGYTPPVTSQATVSGLPDIAAVLLVDVVSRDAALVPPRSFMLTAPELAQPPARFGLPDAADDKRPPMQRYAEKAAAAVHVGVQMRR